MPDSESTAPPSEDEEGPPPPVRKRRSSWYQKKVTLRGSPSVTWHRSTSFSSSSLSRSAFLSPSSFLNSFLSLQEGGWRTRRETLERRVPRSL